jgi:D-alanyl-D-alanine carboxypeptidase (penicillin-binding protein 5/6)
MLPSMIQKARHHQIEKFYLYIFAMVAVIALIPLSHAVPQIKIGILPDKKEVTEVAFFNGSAFENVPIKAKAYVVYDVLNKKVIAAKNENERLPLASITKVMTAFTALSHNAPSTKIIIHPNALDGAYDLGLKKDQEWRLDELLRYTLIFSSNDGALEIANNLGGKDAFIKQMNEDAKALGLSLVFTNPAGLDDGAISGGEGSALETAELFAIARKRFPNILDTTTQLRTNVLASTGKVIGIPNTNQDISHLLGAEGSKTGFTINAGGNLGVIVDIAVGHPVVIVVLGSTYEDRFQDIETLYHSLQKSLEK